MLVAENCLGRHAMDVTLTNRAVKTKRLTDPVLQLRLAMGEHDSTAIVGPASCRSGKPTLLVK